MLVELLTLTSLLITLKSQSQDPCVNDCTTNNKARGAECELNGLSGLGKCENDPNDSCAGFVCTTDVCLGVEYDGSCRGGKVDVTTCTINGKDGKCGYDEHQCLACEEDAVTCDIGTACALPNNGGNGECFEDGQGQGVCAADPCEEYDPKCDPQSTPTGCEYGSCVQYDRSVAGVLNNFICGQCECQYCGMGKDCDDANTGTTCTDTTQCGQCRQKDCNDFEITECTTSSCLPSEYCDSSTEYGPLKIQCATCQTCITDCVDGNGNAVVKDDPCDANGKAGTCEADQITGCLFCEPTAACDLGQECPINGESGECVDNGSGAVCVDPCDSVPTHVACDDQNHPCTTGYTCADYAEEFGTLKKACDWRQCVADPCDLDPPCDPAGSAECAGAGTAYDTCTSYDRSFAGGLITNYRTCGQCECVDCKVGGSDCTVGECVHVPNSIFGSNCGWCDPCMNSCSGQDRGVSCLMDDKTTQGTCQADATGACTGRVCSDNVCATAIYDDECDDSGSNNCIAGKTFCEFDKVIGNCKQNKCTSCTDNNDGCYGAGNHGTACTTNGNAGTCRPVDTFTQCLHCVEDTITCSTDCGTDENDNAIEIGGGECSSMYIQEGECREDETTGCPICVDPCDDVNDWCQRDEECADYYICAEYAIFGGIDIEKQCNYKKCAADPCSQYQPRCELGVPGQCIEFDGCVSHTETFVGGDANGGVTNTRDCGQCECDDCMYDADCNNAEICFTDYNTYGTAHMCGACVPCPSCSAPGGDCDTLEGTPGKCEQESNVCGFFCRGVCDNECTQNQLWRDEECSTGTCQPTDIDGDGINDCRTCQESPCKKSMYDNECELSPIDDCAVGVCTPKSYTVDTYTCSKNECVATNCIENDCDNLIGNAKDIGGGCDTVSGYLGTCQEKYFGNELCKYCERDRCQNDCTAGGVPAVRDDECMADDDSYSGWCQMDDELNCYTCNDSPCRKTDYDADLLCSTGNCVSPSYCETISIDNSGCVKEVCVDPCPACAAAGDDCLTDANTNGIFDGVCVGNSNAGSYNCPFSCRRPCQNSCKIGDKPRDEPCVTFMDEDGWCQYDGTLGCKICDPNPCKMIMFDGDDCTLGGDDCLAGTCVERVVDEYGYTCTYNECDDSNVNVCPFDSCDTLSVGEDCDIPTSAGNTLGGVCVSKTLDSTLVCKICERDLCRNNCEGKARDDDCDGDDFSYSGWCQYDDVLGCKTCNENICRKSMYDDNCDNCAQGEICVVVNDGHCDRSECKECGWDREKCDSNEQCDLGSTCQFIQTTACYWRECQDCEDACGGTTGQVCGSGQFCDEAADRGYGCNMCVDCSIDPVCDGRKDNEACVEKDIDNDGTLDTGLCQTQTSGCMRCEWNTGCQDDCTENPDNCGAGELCTKDEFVGACLSCQDCNDKDCSDSVGGECTSDFGDSIYRTGICTVQDDDCNRCECKDECNDNNPCGTGESCTGMISGLNKECNICADCNECEKNEECDGECKTNDDGCNECVCVNECDDSGSNSCDNGKKCVIVDDTAGTCNYCEDCIGCDNAPDGDCEVKEGSVTLTGVCTALENGCTECVTGCTDDECESHDECKEGDTTVTPIIQRQYCDFSNDDTCGVCVYCECTGDDDCEAGDECVMSDNRERCGTCQTKCDGFCVLDDPDNRCGDEVCLPTDTSAEGCGACSTDECTGAKECAEDGKCKTLLSSENAYCYIEAGATCGECAEGCESECEADADCTGTNECKLDDAVNGVECGKCFEPADYCDSIDSTTNINARGGIWRIVNQVIGLSNNLDDTTAVEQPICEMCVCDGNNKNRKNKCYDRFRGLRDLLIEEDSEVTDFIKDIFFYYCDNDDLKNNDGTDCEFENIRVKPQCANDGIDCTCDSLYCNTRDTWTVRECDSDLDCTNPGETCDQTVCQEYIKFVGSQDTKCKGICCGGTVAVGGVGKLSVMIGLGVVMGVLGWM